MEYIQIPKSCKLSPARITKGEKRFAKKLDFKSIKFPVKIRDIHKIKTKNSISISVLAFENKETHPVYVLKSVVKKNMLFYF